MKNLFNSQYARSLIDSSKNPLFTLNTNGIIEDINEASINIIGQNIDTILNFPFVNFIKEKKLLPKLLTKIIAEKKERNILLTIISANGNEVELDFHISLYTDNAKHLTYLILIATNKHIVQNFEIELKGANIEIALQNQEKEKRAAELVIANIELAIQKDDKEKKVKATKELKLSHDSLKISSQYVRSLIEASLDPLVTINSKGKITDVNEASIHVTGIPRDMLIGTDFTSYFTEPAKAMEGYKLVFNKGFVSDYPLTIKHKNGHLTDVLYNASVYKDENGKVLGVFAAARDITDQKRIESYLEKSLTEISGYKLALDASAIVAITDQKGIINYVNDNFCKISRFSREELIGQDHRIVNSNYHEKAYIKNLWKTIANGGIWRGELKNKAQDGTIYWVDTTIVPFLNEQGKIYQYVSIRTDITAQKLLSNYSRSLLEASRDPLFAINSEGIITDLNNASTKITEVSREKLIGSQFVNYFTNPEDALKGYNLVFKNGFVEDFPLTIKDGKLTPALFNGSIYKDDKGNVLGAVVVARVITEQKKFEKELTEAREKAENAARNAEEAKLKAEEAVRSKQQFLSNMSHEIRTPMNAIIGFTKVILKTELTSKQKEYLTAIKISGDALIVLINDILDLAKVDAGKMNFEKIPFKFGLSLSAILHLFDNKIQEKNIYFKQNYDVKIPEILIGDPVRLNQILMNLLSNAVKFTHVGGIIFTIDMISESKKKVLLKFSIKDTGIGIQKDKLNRIFDNFQQGSSSTSRIYGGTGLGLAIVKQLVEPQGGKLEVTSTVNEGSTFSFTLPFEKTDEVIDNAIKDEKVDPDLKNIKVLVVEDIALNQLLMKTLLDDFGFERDIASNGLIAIEKLKLKTYDIILMDLQMPEMNGFEATHYIRTKLKSKIPIIALTADVTTVDLARCTEVGMNDYISKPVDEKLLYNKIIGLVKKPISRFLSEKIRGSTQDKCTDLEYLNQRTKSNPILMKEMIDLYLEQTPVLVKTMKDSLLEKDWQMLNSAVHKMIPSFSIVGISSYFEEIAKKIQEFANRQSDTHEVNEMVLQLENVCFQACKELEEELLNF
jgi:PAS domain S-box-containing protein